MPVSFTRRGYIELFRDGVYISRHTVAEEAYERAIAHAEANGPGRYVVHYPDREIDVGAFILRSTLPADGGGGGGSNTIEPAYFDLQLISPRGTGTGGIGTGTGLNANNRIYFAYPSLEYSIPVAAIGGSWPYTVTLSNAPSGMVAEEYTSASGALLWRIRWPNPTTTASNITVRVTDSRGTYVEGTWSITVGTSGWNFVDASNNAGGRDGSINNPWNSLTELRNNAAAESRTYFKNGTYTPTTTQGAGYFISMHFNSNVHSNIWIAYPGHTPVIDQGYPGSGSVATTCVEFNQAGGTNPPWVEGFTMRNFCDKGFMVGDYNHGVGGCFWGITFHDCGPAITDENSGCINFRDNNGWVRYGYYIANITAYNIGATSSFDTNPGNILSKKYSMSHSLYEGILAYNVGYGQGEFIALKADCPRTTVRACKAISSFYQPFVAGNLNVFADGNSWHAGGEICYNNLAGGGTFSSVTGILLRFEKHHAGAYRNPFKIYRNTLNGRVLVQDAASEDGGFLLSHNVLINADEAQGTFPWVYDYMDAGNGQTVDPTKVVLTENLTNASASGILDANGLLTGTDRTTYLGMRGHEIPA